MARKANANEILDNRQAQRDKPREDQRERAERVRGKLRHTLFKLLAGEPIDAEDGREFFWEFMANSRIMRTTMMTGNAQTYYLLGQKKWAEDALAEAEDVNFDLFLKMRKEAHIRKTGGTE